MNSLWIKKLPVKLPFQENSKEQGKRDSSNQEDSMLAYMGA
jgi:hypothetical protein